jgi:hypothetical protein
MKNILFTLSLLKCTFDWETLSAGTMLQETGIQSK